MNLVIADKGRQMANTMEQDVPAAVFADSRRRHVVNYLDRHDGAVGLADLAREIAAREEGCTISEVDDTRAQRIRTTLYHTHLPKLDDAGVVEFDSSRRTVEMR